MDSLEQKLRDEWEKVKILFFYPQIPVPKLNKETPNAIISRQEHQIEVNPNFVQRFETHKLEIGKVINELLSHEVLHFLKYPGSLLNDMRRYRILRGILPEQDAIEANILIKEAQVNAYMILNVKNPYTTKMRSVVKPPTSDYYGTLLYGLIGKLSGKKLVKLTNDQKMIVDSILLIELLVPEEGIKYVLINAASAIKKYKISKMPRQENDNFYETLQNTSRFCIDVLNRMPLGRNKIRPEKDMKKLLDSLKSSSDNPRMFGIRQKSSIKENLHLVEDLMFPKPRPKPKDYKEPFQQAIYDPLRASATKEIYSAINSLANECNSPLEFFTLIHELFSNSTDPRAKKIMEEMFGTQGSGVGTERSQLIYNPVSVYAAIAKKHKVHIEKHRMVVGGGSYPYENTAFNIGDPIIELNPYSSPRILPGISKKWVRRGTEGFSSIGGIPYCLIVIDNSGSMIYPIFALSIAAACGVTVADTYLDLGSKVAVYTFGGFDEYIGFTRDRKQIYEEICAYSGGGTTFSPSYVEEALKSQSTPFDVCVISDTGISNLDLFISRLDAMPNTHRITVVAVPPYGTPLFDEANINRITLSQNIDIKKVATIKDIDALVLGSVKSSINSINS